MTRYRKWKATALLLLALVLGATDKSYAAQCGSTSAGFEAWKRQFADEAKERGISAFAISSLMASNYSSATIVADRGGGSFELPLDQFLVKRGDAAIIARGRTLKQLNAALFTSIQNQFGVPPGPLLAIWGLETGFGRSLGTQSVLSTVATLAFDCRRSAYFTEQLNAALALIDKGVLSVSARGSLHGEIGQTQFLPKTVLEYGAGGNLDTPDNALTSTANFLKGHGWIAGAGYQPGEPNFGVIQAWNTASVYQRAIAIIGQRIDTDDGGQVKR